MVLERPKIRLQRPRNIWPTTATFHLRSVKMMTNPDEGATAGLLLVAFRNRLNSGQFTLVVRPNLCSRCFPGEFGVVPKGFGGDFSFFLSAVHLP